MAELPVRLYEQDRLHVPTAKVHAFAAIGYNDIGQAYLAIKYASLAMEAGLLYVESTASTSDQERLLDKPTKH